MLVRRAIAVASIGALILLNGCGGDEGGVGVTLADFSVTPDANSASAGDVTFDVTYAAEQTLELVVVKTDLAEDELPLNDEGVDEEGEGMEIVDEIEDIEAGSDESLTTNLDAGNYVLICNLPGHYAQGMHAAFTVS